MFHLPPSQCEKDDDDDDKFTTGTLIGHVDKFSDAIEKLLERSDHPDELIGTVIQLGKHHYMMGAQERYATVCLTPQVNCFGNKQWTFLNLFIISTGSWC